MNLKNHPNKDLYETIGIVLFMVVFIGVCIIVGAPSEV